ncbi:hypothetical protein NDU88_011341 [Pleurodeles waltl]|uniref:Uncharacterized protein n=1 Tax=Pleurodeles waltl TaxID=8319 RepID=A0AAV7S5U5_PLEWA|nr:hypothetical protein NDU88_011341 [Pleurodeles waltl]
MRNRHRKSPAACARTRNGGFKTPRGLVPRTAMAGGRRRSPVPGLAMAGGRRRSPVPGLAMAGGSRSAAGLPSGRRGSL